MSKGLAPLEVSKELKDFVLEFVKNGLDRRFICGSFDLIEKELKRLVDFDSILNTGGGIWAVDGIVAKKLKAFEIIEEKEVDIYGIKNSIDVYDYNAGIENEANFENRMLTEEEYSLVKEALLANESQIKESHRGEKITRG